MNKLVKEKDIVEVLPGCSFPPLVYSQGLVQQSLNCKLAVVEFVQEKRWHEPGRLEVINAKKWIIPWKFLKVVESAYDDRCGTLEEEILGLEADLVTARCCISISEELREQQHNLIQKLIEEIDVLKQELYLERGGYK